MPEILKNISRVNRQLHSGHVIFGDAIYDPGGICGPRIQRDYQLVIVNRGLLDLKLDNRWVHIAAGHAILLSPGHREHFHFARDAETSHGWCAVTPKAVPSAMRRVLQSSRGPAPFGSHLATLFELGHAAPAGAAGGSPVGLLRTFLGQVRTLCIPAGGFLRI